MTATDWAALAVSITTLIGALAMGIRHLVKHYLSELRPNGGSSVKDKINLLEEKVELLTELVKEALRKSI
jgi:CRISPR/Cas system-associated protein Cas5 (RAMP superfamily)